MMNKMPLLRAGVMGWPVAHSLSPRLHRFWLDRYGIAGRYDALPVEPQNLGAALRALPHEGLRGVNLTVPHKEAALSFLDSVDPVARRIGAVNLVTVENGRLCGRNTDAFGFAENLRAARVAGRSAALLGAGGAARAIIAALQDMGFTEIRIANRTAARAKKLADEFGLVPFAWNDPALLEGADLLINATSLGMQGQPPLAIDLDALPRAAAVADIVYAPLETALLQKARDGGHKTVDGLGMLLHQARPAFAAFFGRDPEVGGELRAAILAGKN